VDVMAVAHGHRPNLQLPSPCTAGPERCGRNQIPAVMLADGTHVLVVREHRSEEGQL